MVVSGSSQPWVEVVWERCTERHDLGLGQQVALKFLTTLSAGTGSSTRLRREVRLARQISHPNVCRVYDIGEAHGELYLSMEYVDGEDLSALLKRIGRVPVDKGIEIARKLCAGLSAAHSKGVLHRDLKPANIMIDARGEVRIMDFGLAAVASELERAEVRSGTPAYMAPEQLAGREATVRSDIYALGLVLYELLTGRRAFPGQSVQELLRERESHPSAAPSTMVPELGPRFEHVVLRCLEPDPKQRPASALDVAAELPGANPLAEALAAGETPSPDAVAASGGVGVISLTTGLMCLAAIAIGITANVWMSRRTMLNAYVPISVGVETMTERARATLAAVGYIELPTNLACKYEVDLAVFRNIRDTNDSPARWDVLRTDRLSAVGFRCISSGPTETERFSVLLDPAGRLVDLVAPPVRPGDTPPSPDWEPLLRSAGLDPRRFTEGVPRRLPPVFAEQRLARVGTLEDGRPAHVDAAWYGAVPVFFALDTALPDTRARPEALAPTSTAYNPEALGVVTWIVMSVALLLAPRLLHRADRRGAFRGAVVMGLATAAVVELTGGEPLRAVVSGLYFWVVYIVLEPSARRFWPDMLIGWSRLLAGRVRDPLVGRDIVFGLVAGMTMAAAHHVWFLAPTAMGLPPPAPIGQPDTEGWLAWPFMGGRYTTALMPAAIGHALVAAPFVSFTLALLASVFRDRRRAGIAWVILWTGVKALQLANLQVWAPWMLVADVAFGAITFSIGLFVLTRFGLLAMVVHLLPFVLLTFTALQFDPATPVASSAYLIVGSLVALTLYGLYTAVGRPPIFGSSG